MNTPHTLLAFAVKDVKSELFNTPHFVPSKGVAIRSFGTACEDKTTQLNKYPEDFSLFHVGEYSTETGELTPCTPDLIANASEFTKDL